MIIHSWFATSPQKWRNQERRHGSMRKSLPAGCCRAPSPWLERQRDSCTPGKSHEVRVGHEFCRSNGTHCGIRQVAANAASPVRICARRLCTAVALQRALELEIGFPHSFLMFYPTILIVALLAGFLPGATATFLSARLPPISIGYPPISSS